MQLLLSAEEELRQDIIAQIPTVNRAAELIWTWIGDGQISAAFNQELDQACKGAIGVKPPTVVLQFECLRHHYLGGCRAGWRWRCYR